jgi:diguanylate cyclase (GGDEF)-like protein/PAS domain S-box-containing protein
MHKFLKSDAAWRQFLSNLRDYAIVILDEEGNVAAWNEGARALQLYADEEIIGTNFSVFYTPEARAVGHPERELAAAASVGRYEEEGWRVRKDNTRFWAHVIINAIYDEHHVLCGFGKVMRDLTEPKQAAEQSANVMKLLEHTARTDYLTGVNNRRSLDQFLAATISAARRHDRLLSLAMIDFDRFKMFNDEFGHQAGDSYLRQAASKWRNVLRPDDFIARYGGEEFVVLLPSAGRDGAVACMERLRAATPGPLTCSVGLAVWDGTESPSALIGRADQAVYQAKAGGRDRLVIAAMPETDAAGPTQARLTVV